MLAPSGRGLILYQAYGNLYVMAGFSTWMDFGGNTRDWDSFGEETDKRTITTPESCLYYTVMIRPDIAFVVGKLNKYTCNPGTQHWQAIQRVLKYLKKTMDYRLTYTGYPLVLEGYTDEAKWLKNLLLEIPLWSKPIALISINCDSAATLAKVYSQMYDGKSRHLGVRHSMIRVFIINGVISIEFVRSQQNLADHLTKGLARDLVIKSAEGIGLKSN
uniref:Zinc finger, CCHC-type n=1 Tax=Tanacetum cinerariifolium TaxID=118510 RepID=A0A6L2J2U6_TANCI|nr:hypothetical protein [Tanacetum cinerariifolium]